MKYYQRKEKRDSQSQQGRLTKRSGGLWFDPGDVHANEFLTDSKTTNTERFSITKKMWKKIRKEALFSRKLPCLSIGFTTKEHPEAPPEIELVVLDKNDFDTFFKETV